MLKSASKTYEFILLVRKLLRILGPPDHYGNYETVDSQLISENWNLE